MSKTGFDKADQSVVLEKDSEKVIVDKGTPAEQKFMKDGYKPCKESIGIGEVIDDKPDTPKETGANTGSGTGQVDTKVPGGKDSENSEDNENTTNPAYTDETGGNV